MDIDKRSKSVSANIGESNEITAESSRKNEDEPKVNKDKA
jgi:hypothetical protein